MDSSSPVFASKTLYIGGFKLTFRLTLTDTLKVNGYILAAAVPPLHAAFSTTSSAKKSPSVKLVDENVSTGLVVSIVKIAD